MRFVIDFAVIFRSKNILKPHLKQQGVILPDEARRLGERFECRYTPKHGRWLDMAEAELSALSSQCLGE